MKHQVSITDHIKECSVERQILGEYLSTELSESTTILLVWHETINKAYIDRFPCLKAVVRYGVGFDNIDLDYCKSKGIVVCNTPDYGVGEVSDTALAMILSLSRNLRLLSYNAFNHKSSWQGDPLPPISTRLANSQVGIVGLGRIGSCLAHKLKNIVGNVSFYDPYLPSGIEKIMNTKRYFCLDDMLSESDIISINTTLNKTTDGLVNNEFIGKMKKSSILVNVSRGNIYGDISALPHLLKSGHLSGFASDVWGQEPPTENDKLFNTLMQDKTIKDRVIITPHTSYFSVESLKECRTKAAQNCLRIVDGDTPLNIL